LEHGLLNRRPIDAAGGQLALAKFVVKIGDFHGILQKTGLASGRAGGCGRASP
jgi:hypothetical protein